ncbi:hypothetical protein ACEWPL_018680 [Roseovarius sp. S1116L3]|uniref:hypothetical protein n=1 Tax=Roseovarius roseus TaxID=3342636 RepID=UPI00372BC844
MYDDYLNKKTAPERPGSAEQQKAREWFPEIVEPEDVGRSYPATKPFSLRAALRKLFLR